MMSGELAAFDGPDDDAVLAEYQASRARYIRTVTSGVEQRLMETIGKRREPLKEEIANLALLAHNRYEVYQEALKAYKAKAPGRVTATGLQPPSAAERTIRDIDKLYKAAVKAAAEFREIEPIIKKRRTQLTEIDWKLREQVEQYGRSLISQLETKAGLESAFQRDPLLGRAHARMQAAQARRAAIREEPVAPVNIGRLPIP
jgi:hypothetical protein